MLPCKRKVVTVVEWWRAHIRNGVPSEDDARNFYNAYAKQSGFSIRVNSYYWSKKDNSIIYREFCCGDETRRLRSRPIPGEGCKAMMTVRRRDNGKWYVAKSEKNHNHEMVTPTMRHVLRSTGRNLIQRIT
ncbi:hypothetical protein GH714_031653 [Hevea brasiliensis]|uniref:FAR1 domain-containing protein n=1 Tax=Hevea brasiliensis TaxID=3981 RepID=A0A6A6LGC8_HEVBR|nr:hypothetical protein GH714_031653 [Hevea brasiliensis]